MSLPVASVYVHAPFCARRCFYCDFAVHVRRHPDPAPWLAAVAGEVAALEAEGRAHLAPVLDTLYLGGGTPSLLGAGAARGLRAALAGAEGVDRVGPGTEFTAEANPESFDDEVARGWADAGVTRVSLGTQSFQEAALRWMGRLHGPTGAVEAVAHARRVGLGEVSVDLIFGLPAAVERDWARDLEAALALGVPHLSLYGLTAEVGTPLGRRVGEGRIAMPDDERYREEYLEAHERLTAAGYEHYEVSNFALPGHRSRHNAVYWAGGPYLGLGNGAHSHLPPTRRWNLRDWDAYRAEVSAGRLPLDDAERVSPEAARMERAWLGLRTDAGLPEAELSAAGVARVSDWVRRGLAERRGPGGGVDRAPSGEGEGRRGGARVVLTPEGWLLLDRLAVELEGEVRTPAERLPSGPPIPSAG